LFLGSVAGPDIGDGQGPDVGPKGGEAAVVLETGELADA
jgi:hypothetical protein